MVASWAQPLCLGILRGLKRIHDHNIAFTSKGGSVAWMHLLLSNDSSYEVHRDVKTENILLQSGDVPVLADFGQTSRLLMCLSRMNKALKPDTKIDFTPPDWTRSRCQCPRRRNGMDRGLQRERLGRRARGLKKRPSI